MMAPRFERAINALERAVAGERRGHVDWVAVIAAAVLVLAVTVVLANVIRWLI